MDMKMELKSQMECVLHKIYSNSIELQKKVFMIINLNHVHWRKYVFPVFVFYIWTYNICISQYCIIYKVVYLLFSLGIILQMLPDVSSSFCTTFLNGNASWWMWILVAGCCQELCGHLVAGPRSSSLCTNSCFGEISVAYYSNRTLRESFLSGVSRHMKQCLIPLDWLPSAATHCILSSLLLLVTSAVLWISFKLLWVYPGNTSHNDTKLYILTYFLSFVLPCGNFDPGSIILF